MAWQISLPPEDPPQEAHRLRLLSWLVGEGVNPLLGAVQPLPQIVHALLLPCITPLAELLIRHTGIAEGADTGALLCSPNGRNNLAPHIYQSFRVQSCADRARELCCYPWPTKFLDSRRGHN